MVFAEIILYTIGCIETVIRIYGYILRSSSLPNGPMEPGLFPGHGLPQTPYSYTIRGMQGLMSRLCKCR